MQKELFEEYFRLGFQEAMEKKAEVELEKQASYGSPLLSSIGDNFSKGVGHASAQVVVGKGYEALSKGVKSLVGRFSSPHKKLDSRQRKFIADLIMKDPVLKNRDPERVVSYYQTMTNLAPSIVYDPNVVGSFLREATMYDTMNTPTIKSLLEIEGVKARNETERKQGYNPLENWKGA